MAGNTNQVMDLQERLPDRQETNTSSTSSLYHSAESIAVQEVGVDKWGTGIQSAARRLGVKISPWILKDQDTEGSRELLASIWIKFNRLSSLIVTLLLT